MATLAGTWNLHSDERFDEFLKEMGNILIFLVFNFKLTIF